MRILSIRGCNLASLSGPFELDMTKGALGRTGLFAITGPTGSGKSTLLDALCLALFDDTPRLSVAGSTAIGSGDSTLSARDPKSLLRRDAASGFAEVRFLGVDGNTWLSRWSCRRAKNRPGERPQTQTLELTNVDTGERIDGTRTTLKDAIVARLGLSFEQFRRSALLAQGEFAAFLDAKPRERAELLERMTGTQIYAQLSIQAFERAKEAAAALTALEQERARLGVLPGQQRAELERDLILARQHLDEAEETVQAARNARAWQQRMTELERDHATRTRSELTARTRLAEPWVAELNRARQVQGLAGLVDQLDQARAHDGPAAADTLPLRDAVAARVADLQAFTQRRDTAEKAREQAAPDLEHAASLDGRLQELGELAAAHDRATAAALARSVAAAQVLRDAQEGLDAWLQRRGEAAAWLDRNDDAGFAQAWRQGARRDLEQWCTSLAARRTAETELDALVLDDVVAARDAASAQVEGARRARDQTRAVYDRLAAEQGPNVARLSTLQDHVVLADRARREVDAREEAQEELLAARTLAATLETTLEVLQARLETENTRTERAERRARQAESARVLAHHRGELVDGEPCPLCGALEHPVENAPLDELTEDLVQEAADARDALASLKLQVQKARQTREGHLEAAGKQAARVHSLDRALAELSAAWTLPGAPADDAAVLKQELADLQDAARAHQGQRAALDAARQVARLAVEAFDGANTRLVHADAALADGRSKAQLIQDRITAANARLASEAEDLRERLPTGWEQHAALNSDRAIARYDERASIWESHAETLRQADVALDQQTLKDAQREADSTRHHTDELQTAAAEKQHQLARLRQERAGLLGGSSVRVATETLAKAERDAEAAETTARTALQAARAALAEHERDIAAAAALHKEATQRREQLQTQLTRALNALEMTEDAVRTARRTTDWLESRAQDLESAQKAHSAAIAVLEQLTSQRAELAANPAPPVDADQAQLAHRAASRRHTEVELQLQRDDEAHKRSETLVDALDEATLERNRWQALAKLIGSAKGDTFRTFAQGLTLTTLLSHANDQLAQLAPRYQLQRIPNKDLDFQVMDTAMGDEIRGISSLSGGETFMVSLALALGLSSMASKQTAVDTLFIDEGFGSLDQATLHTAISTLEALHQGHRKVGVISHVQGLAERIDVRVEVVRQAPGRSTLRIHGD
jgi:DNA repair protein SbcC/Rad50